VWMCVWKGTKPKVLLLADEISENEKSHCVALPHIFNSQHKLTFNSTRNPVFDYRNTQPNAVTKFSTMNGSGLDALTPIEDLLQAAGVDPLRGLTSAEAQTRLAQCKPSVIFPF